MIVEIKVTLKRVFIFLFFFFKDLHKPECKPQEQQHSLVMDVF